MAPNLRSSAPSTPTGKSASISESSTTTPRKVPTCTKCKRPRAGHPRSGCPYVDSPSDTNSNSTRLPPLATTNNLTDALGSMNIAPPSPRCDEETKAIVRNRRRSNQAANLAPAETLLSLTSESQEIVERLLQPGMFDNDINVGQDTENTGKKARVVRWQETLLEMPVKHQPKTKMPGSLYTPSPDNSVEIAKPSSNKKEIPVLDNPTPLSSIDSLPQPTHRPQVLARTMSLEQRDMFVSNLTRASDATVYVVPADDIYNIQVSAIKLGFHARIVVSKDDHDPQGLLVLGRDEAAVRRLFEKVEVERKKVAPSRLRAAAGGAVVGVVGTWAGLAFA